MITRNIEKGCLIRSLQNNRIGIVQADTGVVLFCSDNEGKQMIVRRDEAMLLYRVFVWQIDEKIIAIVDSTVEYAASQAQIIADTTIESEPLFILETYMTGGFLLPA